MSSEFLGKNLRFVSKSFAPALLIVHELSLLWNTLMNWRTHAAAGAKSNVCDIDGSTCATTNGESGMVWTTDTSSHLFTGGVVRACMTGSRST